MNLLKNKLIKILAVLSIFSFLTLNFSGCYGKFVLTSKIYKWNGSLGNKFIVSGIMWVLMIVPVYEVCGFLDFVFLNTLEFWTGRNPLAMNDNDIESQIVNQDGKIFEIIAKKNRFDIIDLASGKKTSLVFEPASKSWNMETNGQTIKVAKFDPSEGNLIEVIYPDNSTEKVTLK